jgi:hypothetical protein
LKVSQRLLENLGEDLKLRALGSQRTSPPR